MLCFIGITSFPKSSSHVIPDGGSNPLGALGYVACAEETLGQMFDMSINLDYIVTASGSADTHAGLISGLRGNNAYIPLIGISVSRNTDPQRDLVYNLATQICHKLEIQSPVEKKDILVFDDYVGKGYSYATQGMVDAVQLLIRTESILVDPVYSGKTLDGMIDLVEKGYFKGAENILFIHTGDAPVFYVYEDETLHGVD